MYCVLFGSESVTYYPALQLESADENWRCCCTDQPALCFTAHAAAEVLVLLPGEASRALLASLLACPPIRAPWIVAAGWDCGEADLSLPIASLASLPDKLHALVATGQLPSLCVRNLPRLTALAVELLRTLTLRPTLGAWRFLPDMLAAAAAHPALLDSVSTTLYPLFGASCGLKASAVERSLRIAVESAWSTSPLSALDRYFGQSIDPEKGKPTNREFLCQMAEHLYLAAQA